MKKFNRIAIIVLIAIFVTCIGALAGWYLVLRMKGQTISFSDAARGFGFGTPSANENGSTYENLGIGGGGAGGLNVGGGTESAGAGPLGGAGTGGTVTNGVGGGGNTGASAANDQNSSNSSGITPKTPRLWRVTKTPIAGFQFATSALVAFFAERATGYVFRADAMSGELLRRTNTLIPKVYEAHVAHDGGAIYQTVNEVTGVLQTFSGSIATSSSNIGSFVGVNLRNNISALDANPDRKSIFFVITDGTNYSGYFENWVEGKKSTENLVFSSNVGSWKPFALADGRLIIAEKPQDGAAGYAYEIAPNGALKPLLRAAPGLTLLPLSGSSALLFGTSDAGTLSLFAQTGTTTLSLPIATVADKCVWAPYTPAHGGTPASHLVVYCAVPIEISSKNFLEMWYMGALHTSDSWWRTDLTSGKSDQILAAESEGTALDVVDPAIDQSGTMLGFKNGRDGSLWILRIAK